MLIAGKLIKEKTGSWWCVEADAIGAFTQGSSRKDAVAMLKDLVEAMLNDASARVTVHDVGMSDDGTVSVIIECSDPGALAARVLRYQREVHGLTLEQVSKTLGITSRNAFARYEQNRATPTLGKYGKLLAAVAPEMSIMVGFRKPARAAKASKTPRAEMKHRLAR